MRPKPAEGLLFSAMADKRQPISKIAEASGRDHSAVATPRHSFQQQRRDSDAAAPDNWSNWGSPGSRNDAADDEPEHERLLDPADPDDFELDDLGEPGKATKDADGEDSPYPEVRAAVRNYDEDVPCNTFRAWTIGLSLTVIGASMNTLFSLRQPSISIGPLVAQVIAYPIGHAWARIIPEREFNIFGLRWNLNPGPFNVKEHSIITVMASVSFGVAYSTDIILAQLVFYKQDFGIIFQLLLTISTQSLGYGIAGVMRKFLGMHHDALYNEPTLTIETSLSCLDDMARELGSHQFAQRHA